MTEKIRRRRRISIDSINEPSLFEEPTSSINTPTDTPRVRRRQRRSNLTNESSVAASSTSSSQDFADSAIAPPKTEPSTAEVITENNLPKTSSSESPQKTDFDSFLIDERNITNPSLINTIDRIRTEFAEDKRFTSEQKYWDETHNWGIEESDDYWHFLGSYE